MDTKSLPVPLVVYLGAPLNFMLISTLDEASEFLLDHWAGNNSPEWAHAMHCCTGEEGVDEASSAFLAALKHAGMCYDSAIVLH
jgi:hypothetical protein